MKHTRVHAEAEKKGKFELQFCSICGQSFETEYKLVKHLNMVHPEAISGVVAQIRTNITNTKVIISIMQCVIYCQICSSATNVSIQVALIGK